MQADHAWRRGAPVLTLLRSNFVWERWARRDPLYGICTWPGMKGKKWTLDEFLATGIDDVAMMWHQMSLMGREPPRGGRVLDFGCGVGRISRNLVDRFDEVVGVDASPTMVERARELNSCLPTLRFELNRNEDLACFGSRSFDAVVSLLVLQHIPPRVALCYLDEFVRVLRPGGQVVFQVPEQAGPPTARRHRMRATLADLTRGRPLQYEMHAHSEVTVRCRLRAAGAETIDAIEDGRAGAWGRSMIYAATKDDG